MQSLARLPLVFACLLLGPLAVIAKEPHADTNKITSLTPEQARKLVATFKDGGLDLSHLTTLDADTAKALAEFKGQWLSLDGVTKLDADTAEALAEFKIQLLTLEGLKTLDTDTAQALAEFKGLGLSVNGVITLDTDTAKALAEFKGQGLYLNGLETADAGAFKELLALKAWVWNGHLPKLTSLDADTAKMLAANEKWNGRLPALTAFETHDSVAIAQALATTKGPLSLPKLKKISPKTLTALIEKRDVQIPLIETLELIQEPDGSVTEDFVIPEWLKDRQK